MIDAPYQVMPPLSADEYEALKADIAARGVQVPVEYDELGAILDGHHRVQICQELEISNWPRLVRYGLTDVEKRRHARRLNLDRRHLDTAAKRKLIEAELREQPEASDRAIAGGLGVDHKTVGAVRDDMESTGEIPQLNERKGKDGKARRIVQFVPATPEEERGVSLSAKALNERNRSSYREGARGLAKGLSDATAALSPTGRKFACVYADPAWSRKAGFGNRAYENHYTTMSWADIIAMPVKERLLPNAWGFLWIPRAHMFALHPVEIPIDEKDASKGTVTVKMPLAWAVARAWGFDNYSTCFVWTKTDEAHPEDHGSGLIVWDQDEILLLFKRGAGLPMPDGKEKVGSNYRARSEGHSAKPAYYRDMINRMTDSVQVLELFAREDDDHVLPPNFFTWGNQSKNTAEIACDESFASDTGEIENVRPPADVEPATEPDLPQAPDAGSPLPEHDAPQGVVEPAPVLLSPSAPAGAGSLHVEDELICPPFLLRKKSAAPQPAAEAG
jgi:N6-adenosine-specific RNA methylase IME4/ParB-like chromosome segregation protein Spo0J